MEYECRIIALTANAFDEDGQRKHAGWTERTSFKAG